MRPRLLLPILVLLALPPAHAGPKDRLSPIQRLQRRVCNEHGYSRARWRQAVRARIAMLDRMLAELKRREKARKKARRPKSR